MLEFFEIVNTTIGFSSEFQGHLGLAPIHADVHRKKYNFMYQLKQAGKIDHLIASLFIRSE